MQRLIQWTVILLATASVINCGAKKTSSGIGGAPRGNTSNPSTQNLLGECTRIVPSGISITGQISSYYSAGSSQSDRVMANLQSMPAEIANSSTHFIQIFRWKEPSSGNKQVNTIPVPFYYMHKFSGVILENKTFNRVSKGDIQTLITNNNLSVSGVTTANFFQNYYLILTGMEWQWEAIVFALYNSDSGTSAIASANSLLPPFYADPNVYSNKVPVANLQVLHPLNAYRSSGASELEFKGLTDSICNEFFGQVRTLASVDEAGTESWSILGWIKQLVGRFLNYFFGL